MAGTLRRELVRVRQQETGSGGAELWCDTSCGAKPVYTAGLGDKLQKGDWITVVTALNSRYAIPCIDSGPLREEIAAYRERLRRQKARAAGLTRHQGSAKKPSNEPENKS